MKRLFVILASAFALQMQAQKQQLFDGGWQRERDTGHGYYHFKIIIQ